MESELCPSDEPVPAGGSSPQDAQPLPASEAEDLDSFNLIEPPPLDWRSDTSSEVASLGASEDPSPPPPVDEAAGLGDGDAMGPSTPDVSDPAASPVDGQPDVSDPAASPVAGQLELAGEQKTVRLSQLLYCCSVEQKPVSIF